MVAEYSNERGSGDQSFEIDLNQPLNDSRATELYRWVKQYGTPSEYGDMTFDVDIGSKALHVKPSRLGNSECVKLIFNVLSNCFTAYVKDEDQKRLLEEIPNSILEVRVKI